MSLEDRVKGKQIEREAERYLHDYRDYVELLESRSTLSKVRTITPYDIYALGKQLESFEFYRDICEEEGTLAQLGQIPKIALDVITAAYGTSPISAIGSVQPIEEESGLVYYKNVVAQSTRGNVTAGQSFVKSDAAEDVIPIGYAGDQSVTTVGTTTTATSYNLTFPNTPLRPQRNAISIPDLGLSAKDDGEGHLIGYNIQATINYTTGAVVLTLASAPTAGHAIVAQAVQDFEASADLPKIIFKLTTKTVNARVFALKDTIGIEQNYAMKKRFGLTAEDEVATDLVAAINAEIFGTAITQLYANAVGNVNWSRTPPAGVSLYEHQMIFKNVIADAEANIIGNAGRGTVNVLIAGRNAASTISSLNGFTKIADGTTLGPHIFGSLDGIMVIRVPNSGLLGADQVLALYNGTSPFESALCYAPYMPLVITTALPSGSNPLLNQKACAVWAAVDILVGSFCTKITITP